MIAENPEVAPVRTEGERALPRLFYGPQEVADLLGSSRGYVYTLLDGGHLKSLKL
jgi:hypothetical protein